MPHESLAVCVHLRLVPSMFTICRPYFSANGIGLLYSPMYNTSTHLETYETLNVDETPQTLCTMK